MAQSIASALAAHPGALLVGFMGRGHVIHGHGVPHQLRDLGVSNVGTLLPLSAGGECKDLRAGLADAVFMLPAQAMPKPAPPRLGVQLEDHEGGVRIVAVRAGSLADATGLKDGDRILEMAGRPVQKTITVIALVRLQPAGTWLPLRIKRGEETLELVVRFPPEKS
jgi:membrane-associated protease RseP (regulator of RpoE activity)